MRFAAALLLLLLPATALAQEDVGHKILGALGLGAGAQRPAGIYVSDRFVYYAANRLVDREGETIPVGLDLDAIANAIGVGATFHIPGLATYYNASVGLPLAQASANTERPEASLDRFGLGDLYVQPARLGWRLPQVDVVTGYAFYAPTGRTAIGGTGGVGRGYWTQELSLGSTLYFDRQHEWQLSALGSWEHNGRNRNIDITRGDTVQIQGGFGATFARAASVGVAGYALWQVSDDTGSDLPPLLRGARDRAYGLGPEIGFMLPPIGMTLRYTHDVSVRSRPLGGTLLFGINWLAWRPRQPGA